MISVVVENYQGEKLQLTGNKNFELSHIDGLNPPTASIVLTDLAGMDGAIFNSARLPKRNIVLTIVYQPPIEENRNLIYKYFPVKAPLRLYFETETKSVWIDGYTEANEVGLFSKSQQSKISIVCPNPYFKDGNEIDVDFSNLLSLFEFPFTIDAEGVEFSSIERASSTIVNMGTVSTGAIFTLTATTSQILNPTIYNETTNEYFGLNVDMDQGDIIVINTHKGEKSAILKKDGTITSVVGSRSSGSKWLQLAAGENKISYDCDEGSAGLQVSIQTTINYEGL